ncbi:type IV pilus twitching motility protein PilT [bacterium]|nr:type IV pilus twitching motility protein PilT [bacterium]
MPAHADPTKFFFTLGGGRYVGKLIDNAGAKVLILRPTTEPEPEPESFLAGASLELDVRPEEGVTIPASASGDEQVIQPKLATGTIQIDKLLTAAVKSGVSDIHITTGLPPVFRVDGHMRPQPTKVLTPDDTNGLMKAITPERCQAELAEKGGTDFGFAFGEMARFRVSVFKQRGSVAMVLRQIPTKMLTPEQLGVPEICKKMVCRPRGLFLVTGPTGSGKSTTLASLINFINENYDHHIITIEDPIEFYHQSKKSTVNQREIGNDVPSFSEALRRALRQDPDVILVGELRDLETIEAAISAAETGHVVFGTLHTTGAQGTVNRIIDAFPTNQQEQVRTQLSTAIIGVVSQALLPKIGGGRCAAYEILVCTPAIGNLIRENKTFRINSAIQTGTKLGMQLLDDHLFRLWNEKKVREEDVLAKAQSFDDLAKRIANAKRGVYEEETARKDEH